MKDFRLARGRRLAREKIPHSGCLMVGSILFNSMALGLLMMLQDGRCLATAFGSAFSTLLTIVM